VGVLITGIFVSHPPEGVCAGLQEVRFRFDFEGTKILTMD
jgi:hypothetical protein